MEVYAQPDIELATPSLRGDTVGPQEGQAIADKENLRPCGFIQSTFSEPTAAKAQTQTRSVLEDVTHRFPADPGVFLVPQASGSQSQNSNAATQNLATATTAAASRLRRMR